jgi:polar amino acid transport system substrate-binding protein
MLTRKRVSIVMIGLVAAIGLTPALAPAAPAEPRSVNIAVRELTPFVMTNDNVKSGYTIDILDEIAKRAGWNLQYLEVDSVAEQLKAVSEGRADVGAGAITITADRERDFDFSQPILDSGLRILVAGSGQKPATPGLMGFLKLLFSKMVLIWLAAAVAISLIPAHITWLLERRHDDPMVSKAYFPGIFQAFRWNLGAIAASADDSPRHPAARIMAIGWGFVSIIFIAYYTATLTANITVQKLDSAIKSPSDLVGKSVCTVAETTSAASLQQLGVTFDGVGVIDDCYRGLEQGRFDAVVYDAPVLSYYATRSNGSAALVGALFEPQQYGLAFKPGSSLREEADRAMLELREDDGFRLIKQKWFGPAAAAGSGF